MTFYEAENVHVWRIVSYEAENAYAQQALADPFLIGLTCLKISTIRSYREPQRQPVRYSLRPNNGERKKKQLETARFQHP